MLEVSLLGVGTVLHLQRHAWSIVKLLRQATNEYTHPPLSLTLESFSSFDVDEMIGTVMVGQMTMFMMMTMMVVMVVVVVMMMMIDMVVMLTVLIVFYFHFMVYIDGGRFTLTEIRRGCRSWPVRCRSYKR